MYCRLAKKAKEIIKKYNINEFPIPVHYIEQLIEDTRVKIIMKKHMKHACIIGDNLVVGEFKNSRQARYNLTHEYLHIKEHYGNNFSKGKLTRKKQEKQALAFAAYFLMPVEIFEDSLKETENPHELAEMYGVTVELVKYRKELSKALLESGFYHILDEAIFFNF